MSEAHNRQYTTAPKLIPMAFRQQARTRNTSRDEAGGQDFPTQQHTHRHARTSFSQCDCLPDRVVNWLLFGIEMYRDV
eukprot:783519-Heterocapsa_arctica.AAC.1